MKFLVRLTFADASVQNIMIDRYDNPGQLGAEGREAVMDALISSNPDRLLRTVELFPIHAEVVIPREDDADGSPDG